ncbi:1,4-dihydroxy-2-naphthoate polyprenyltransferase [Rubellicoccus peritrichatus]|uniref:1,4-dihydroxy-2-naphthoate octaprenyltransferase n=1 Tax=Rubellicoccus peritrichatus TaxID=3080537 RepID=A0AAQ3LEQ5_9BACT|nr:1,4-dihydroxy-2-naphthoate polyprenyltransferase [Puniceicoccus sp. CR14]WOO43224.1 1,4-dihydroxy-2-naphthoate polyprenyltransferase [Puniceicoccus sp. CR14]
MMPNPWILAARPKTLVAAVMPVALGTAFAWHDQAFASTPALICLVFAILIQIGTNYANDYYDGIKGTDTNKRIGPTRAVAKGLISPKVMLQATIAILAVAFLVGLGLIYYGGWWLLVVGIASVVCAIAYTGGPYPLGYNGWGDVFVVLFFGLIAVPFTYYVQAGTFSSVSLIAGLGMGLIINNLLVVNNYRDIEEDKPAGKKTLIVRFGRGFGLKLYAGSYLIALSIPLVLAGMNILAWWAAAIVPMSLMLLASLNTILLKRAVTAEDFNTVLGQTAKSVLFYGIAFNLALMIG